MQHLRLALRQPVPLGTLHAGDTQPHQLSSATHCQLHHSAVIRASPELCNLTGCNQHQGQAPQPGLVRVVVRHIKQKGEDVQQVADCCHSKACRQDQHSVSGVPLWNLGKLRILQLWIGHCLCASLTTAPGSEEILESTLTQIIGEALFRSRCGC